MNLFNLYPAKLFSFLSIILPMKLVFSFLQTRFGGPPLVHQLEPHGPPQTSSGTLWSICFVSYTPKRMIEGIDMMKRRIKREKGWIIVISLSPLYHVKAGWLKQTDSPFVLKDFNASSKVVPSAFPLWAAFLNLYIPHINPNTHLFTWASGPFGMCWSPNSLLLLDPFLGPIHTILWGWKQQW